MEQWIEFYHKYLQNTFALLLNGIKVYLYEAKGIQFNSRITFVLKANSELLCIKLHRTEHRSCGSMKINGRRNAYTG
jgi:hypothetical protein